MNNFTLFGMEGDFPFQFINLLLILIPVLKAAYDVFLFEKRFKPVNHKKSLILFLTVGAALATVDFYFSEVTYLIQSMFMGLAYQFLIFDYLRNKFAKKPFFYVDRNPESDAAEDSWWDVNIYSKLSWYHILFFKLWVFLLAIACYYFSSYI